MKLTYASVLCVRHPARTDLVTLVLLISPWLLGWASFHCASWCLFCVALLDSSWVLPLNAVRPLCVVLARIHRDSNLFRPLCDHFPGSLWTLYTLLRKWFIMFWRLCAFAFWSPFVVVRTFFSVAADIHTSDGSSYSWILGFTACCCNARCSMHCVDLFWVVARLFHLELWMFFVSLFLWCDLG